MKRIAGVLAGVSLLVLSLAAAVPADHKVEISDKGYSPQFVEVVEGHKVVWVNTSQKEHSVTAVVKAAPDQDKDKPLFDSGPIKAGATFEYTFSKAGTYNYGCTMDKAMTGTVTVKAKP